MTAWAVDLVDEAIIGALARPGRAALTAAGTTLGIAALVATVGVARTAGGQVLERFDELTATSVTLSATEEAMSRDDHQLWPIPWAADARLEGLRGVRAAGSLSELDHRTHFVRTVWLQDPTGESDHEIPLVGASPGLLGAVRGVLATGRWFDRGHDDRSDRVAVLGPGAARRLRIDRVSQQPMISIGDESFAVIGILRDVDRQAILLNAVIVPEGTARADFGLRGPEQFIVDTAIGAAQLIGRQGPIALAPNEPGAVRAQVPADLGAARRGVETDINSMFMVLGMVSLIIGALGIANVTLVSVFERTGEIGLRRALGASRAAIVVQVLFESAFIGSLGGVVGAAVGIVAVVATAAAREWTPLLDVGLAIAAPGLGLLVGVVAGLYPSWKAGAIEPASAVRAGVA